MTKYMSPYKINCPKCSAALEVELYDVIDVVHQPELKDDLFHNRLNRVTCSSCDFVFRVDKSLLYKDAEKGYVVFLAFDQQLRDELNSNDFSDYIDSLLKLLPDGIDSPQVHVVLDRTELVERVFMQESGMDERVLEYIKYLIFTRNTDRIDPRQKNLLFNAQDSTEEDLLFVIQDLESRKLEGMLTYKRKAYDVFCQMFDHDDHTPDLLELFPGPYISARRQLINESEGLDG